METWYNDTVTNTTALLSHVEDMNKSIYYTIQNPNPELADCEPTILKVEVKVRGRANPQNYDYCLEYIFMELLLLLWFAKFWLSKIFERKTFFIAALFCRRVREHLGNKRELGFLYLRDEYKKEAKSFCSQRIQGALIAFCTFKTATINQHTFSSFPEKKKFKKKCHIAGLLGLEVVDWWDHYHHRCIFRRVWQRDVHGGFISAQNSRSGFQPASNLSLRGRHSLFGL